MTIHPALIDLLLASSQRLTGAFYFDYLAIVKNGIMGNLMTASTCAEHCAKAN